MTNPRLSPDPGRPNYLLLRALAAQLEEEIDSALAAADDARILDLGCGARPYEPLFAPRASTYVGVDGRAGPGVDVVAPADAVPLPDASFDCVLCSQVLEHVPRPEAVIREVHRLLVPGGTALVSTHGVARYHPNPDDLWRWTHAGFQRLLETAAPWAQVRVRANGGAAGALVYLAGTESEALMRGPVLARAHRGVVRGANAIASRVDEAMARRRGAMPGLVANYLAIARRA